MFPLGYPLLVSRAIFRGVLLRRCVRLQSGKSRSSSQNKWLDRQSNDHYTKEAKLQDFKSRAAFKLIEIDDKFQLFKRNQHQSILDLGFAPGAWSQVARMRSNENSVILGVDILACKPPKGVNSIQANILSKKTQEYIRWFFRDNFNLNRVDTLDKVKGFLHDDDNNITNNNSQDATSPENFENTVRSRYPVDVIVSDMYDISSPNTGYWNNLTNMPYYRLANTTGIKIKDHEQSIDLCDAALVTAIDLLKPGGAFVCKIYTGKSDADFKRRLRHVFNKVASFKPLASRQESKETYFVGLQKKANVDKLKVFTE
ncbi:hypothetical protein TPHA_0J02530 [Tetrapisispora phaffii CBS 4417]|uniref:rRNA methyltransferase 2, mitochondrial n=1 Tax=Tetrapisispora phaffii (strain ATCC 24235 / CBS 4417 / NBRC 1672 / NRRL Y-8282 / UCD 70-5) TaxID=1071381 RepID=G8BYY1_TETPH|nr:hypothetical protein TPHA_0J02530 [Tetrapisispora phaffii CBS 4417]CCE65073.1 hypothetical protein TPHA_0J02530 [Tetrapisispora phaffii CBS 4417]